VPHPTPALDPLEPRLLLAAPPSFFNEGPAIPVVAEQNLIAAKADFNNDGRLDLAVAGGLFHSSPATHFTGGLQILLNQGKGHFTSAGQPQTLSEPQVSSLPGTSIVAADFNDDHHPDVALLDDGKVSLYLGDGAGSLTPAGRFLANDLNDDAVVTGDFNGDGRPDLAVSGRRVLAYHEDTHIVDTEKQIAVLLNTGAAGFLTLFTHMAGNEGYTLAAVDYNHDGRSDLAVPVGSRIQILTSKGDGTFDFPASLDTGGAQGLIAADVNRDGLPDLLFPGGSVASYTLALPTGGFGPVIHVSLGAASAQNVVAGDFNGDGRTDIVAGTSTGDGHRLFLQQSNGVFAPVADSSRFNPDLAGDFNNDGVDDVYSVGRIFYASPPPAPPVGPVYTSRKHTLVISGTRRSDTISVSVAGDHYVVLLNRGSYTVPLSSVRRMQITTGRGYDSITLDAGVFCSALISAGAANDTIRGGSGDDTLQGDNGDDLLDGGGGVDFLQGGKGDDRLTGGAGFDTLFGNRGADTFSTSDTLDELVDRAGDEPLL